ncbi:hypothetical protein E1301_Tti018143 [Triplophysa tibetana]|uniref:Uncharacterized protein n=1 Tax=Triplophysa tibetana TaxID=1572043 RepID=A0A5A9PJX0_9TELE|nr:hypothetical protein E1301_Tti018143 [Triplophysa tibetana]
MRTHRQDEQIIRSHQKDTLEDPFDIGSVSCAPTGGNPEAEVEGETSTPSATFSREGTLTGRPQGEQHRARTFTATALIGRVFRSPRVYLQPIAHSTGLCSANRPHTLARREVVHIRQPSPLSNRQCVPLSRQAGLASGGAYACESTFPPSNRLGQCAIYLFFLPKHMAKKLVPHQPPFLPRHWLRIGIRSITKKAPPGGWLGRAAFPLRPGYHVKQKLKDHGIESDTRLTLRLKPDGKVSTPKQDGEDNAEERNIN